MTDPSNIHIALTTKFELSSRVMQVRLEVSLQAIRALVSNGFSVFVNDASQDPFVTEKLKQAGVQNYKTHDPSLCYGKQKLDAVAFAGQDSTAEVVVLMEPEKRNLVPYIQELAHAVVKESADLLVPRRVSLDSYPDFQKHGELMANSAFQAITGSDIDIWFGPVVMSPAGVRSYLEHKLQDTDTWQPTYGYAVRALYEGQKVISYTVDYQHPSSQTEAEATEVSYLMKRINQVYDITNYVHSLQQSLEKQQSSD